MTTGDKEYNLYRNSLEKLLNKQLQPQAATINSREQEELISRSMHFNVQNVEFQQQQNICAKKQECLAD